MLKITDNKTRHSKNPTVANWIYSQINDNPSCHTQICADRVYFDDLIQLIVRFNVTILIVNMVCMDSHFCHTKTSIIFQTYDMLTHLLTH